MADRISNRVDVTVGASVTGGGANLSAPAGSDKLPANISKDPEIAADARKANATTGQASLGGVAVGGYVDARNIARAGTASIDAGLGIEHRPGTNASATSVVVRGDYRRPMTDTRVGALSLFGGLRAGATGTSGSTFNLENGQGGNFSGVAGHVAVTGGVEMLVNNRFPVRLAAAYQASSGNLGNAVLFTLELGATAVENGKLAWNVHPAEAGFPAPRTACDEAIDGLKLNAPGAATYADQLSGKCKARPQELKDRFDAIVDRLKRFSIRDNTIEQYKTEVGSLVSGIATAEGLAPDDALALMKDLKTLWPRMLPKTPVKGTDPFDFMVRDIIKPMIAFDSVALKDVRILAELADMQDTMLKKADEFAKAGTITNQENCDLKLEVLNKFYGALFPKRGGDRNIQNQYRPRAEALMKELLKAAKDEETSTPGYSAGAVQKLSNTLKKTSLAIPKSTS